MQYQRITPSVATTKHSQKYGLMASEILTDFLSTKKLVQCG